MNTSEHFSHGDVVNVTVTKAAYPFELDYDVFGGLITSLKLQGRVLYADSLGIAISTDGTRCMPGFGYDWSEVQVDAGTRGTFFPWKSVQVINFVADAHTYLRSCIEQEAKEAVYADAHDGEIPETVSKWRTWAEAQDPETLATDLRDAASEILQERAA